MGGVDAPLPLKGLDEDRTRLTLDHPGYYAAADLNSVTGQVTQYANEAFGACAADLQAQ